MSKKIKNKKIAPPDIFTYDNYRGYLKDYFAYRKKLNSSFSLRSFAIQAGIKAHSTLHLAMIGKKDLSVSMAKKLVKLLKLEKNEREYFIFMLNTKSSRFLRHDQTVRSHSALIVLPLVGMPGFRPDPEWISERTRGFIKIAEAKKILIWMKQKKVISIKNGQWSLNSTQVLFDDENPATSDETSEYSYKLFKHAQDSVKLQFDYTLQMDGQMMNQFKELMEDSIKKIYLSLNKEHTLEVKSESSKRRITSIYNVCIQVAEIIPPLEKKKKSYL